MKSSSCFSFFKILTASAVFSISTSGISADKSVGKAERDFLDQHPNAQMISPGVYSVSYDGVEETHAFGINGMAYTLSKMEDQILSNPEQISKDQLDSMEKAKLALESAYYSATSRFDFGGTSTNSGSVCSGAIDYDLTATAQFNNNFSVRASATAGFQQWGASPPLIGNAVLYTFARGFNSRVPVTGIESDLATFNLNGLSFVSASPSNALAGFTNECMEAEAMAYIFVEFCGDFESVSRTYQLNC